MAKVAGETQKARSARGAKAPAARKAKRGTGTGQGTRPGRGTGTKKGGTPEELSGSTAEGGAECLKEAVDRELKVSFDKLAKLLVKKAGTGHLKTVQLVVSLAEQHEAKEPDHGPVRSQAAIWAAEPPWVDPPDLVDPPMWVDPEQEKLKGEECGMERGGRTASELPPSEPD